MVGTSVLAAIFVGGGSRRMGGRPKGRLSAPEGGEPLVERLARVAREAGLGPVLVGDAAPYADLATGVPRVPDDPPGIGPLGGLNAVLRYAGQRRVVAVACDMPAVTQDVLHRLALHGAVEPVVAPRHEDGWWEPLLARYDPPRVCAVLGEALDEGVRSFQRLFGRLAVHPLAIDAELARALADWNTPVDIP